MAAVDRISELPESILHRILSSLSHKQAIQTSSLSRTWRHVGPTGPKIELRESCFKKSGRASLLSVLRKTLQRYDHRNLSVHEFILEMSSSELKSNHQEIDSESISVLDKGIQMLLTNMCVKKFDFSVPNYVVDPSFVFRAEFLTELCLSECKFMSTNDHDHDQPLFKGLKRLSLSKVYIQDQTLEKIMRSSPSIEYLLVSDCIGLETIPVNIFQAEFLTELHLTEGSSLRRHNLIFTAPSFTDLILIKRLKTLSLKRVNIPEETLEKIMCSCPLIESLILTDCVGLTNVRLKNNNNLKHFSVSFSRVNISIVNCLKSLYLKRVELSAEFFESFPSNFPCLEDLELEYCYGFQEIQLTACSIKRLVLIMTYSINPIRATIYAPNIYYFELYAFFPPQLIFHSGTTREWKSHVHIWYGNWLRNQDLNLPWLLQLSKLLTSLRESQISLDLHSNPFKNLKVEDTNDADFCNPVQLEHVNVKGGYESSSFPDLLSCLFLICRPKYISINPITGLKRDKDKLAEFMTFKTIRTEGEMNRGYLWERELEEISMQFWDENSQGWHTVGVEGTSFPVFTSPTNAYALVFEARERAYALKPAGRRNKQELR